MRKERKTFPPARPCSGSPPRARCVLDRGCGAPLGPGLDGPVSPLSALRRCSPWLPSSISPLSAAVPLRGRLALSRDLSPQEVPGGSVMPKALPCTPALSAVTLEWILKLMSELAEQAHFTVLV